ncbi:MAG TPA: YhfC family glutamic-type intramembrane protease [Spirochaetia bacterium]|nr:YhfC family glutamic-type intramembrane protease [Spirochaetia bacterium]
MPGITYIAFIALSLILSVLVPVFLLLYFNRKYGLSFKAVGIGVLVWIVFTQILEKVAHLYLLIINPVTAQFLTSPFIFAVYGGLMAGLFEETGRFLAFRYTLKGKTAWKDGLAYGIGHGGIESILIGVLTASSLARVYLLPANPALLAVGGVERVMALAAQIAFSLIVLYGVKTGKIRYLFYAILGHAALDFFAGLYQSHVMNVWTAEAIIAVFAILAVWLIIRLKTVFNE